MREEIVYLDTSALVKRYVLEPGSDFIRKLYLRAYSGEVVLSFSAWNIGEVLGVLDKARGVGRISSEAYAVSRKRFLAETRRLAKLGSLTIVPLRMKILVEAWKLIEKHHIYEADAVQISSAKYASAQQLITGDKKLHQSAQIEGVKSVYIA